MKCVLSFLFLFLLVVPSVAANVKGAEDMVKWDVKVSVNDTRADIVMQLTNESNKTLIFQFPSSKKYEYVILDSKGKVVFDSTKGAFFLQAMQYLELQAGEQKTFQLKWPYMTNKAKISGGTYTLRATFVPQKVNGHTPSKSWVAQTTFDVPTFRDVHVEKQDNQYTVTGKNYSNQSLSYTVEDGHNILVPSTTINCENNLGATCTFVVNVPKEKVNPALSQILVVSDEKQQTAALIKLK